jgi:hypothetical protein
MTRLISLFAKFIDKLKQQWYDSIHKGYDGEKLSFPMPAEKWRLVQAMARMTVCPS